MPNNCTTKHATDVPQVFAYINNSGNIRLCGFYSFIVFILFYIVIE